MFPFPHDEDRAGSQANDRLGNAPLPVPFRIEITTRAEDNQIDVLIPRGPDNLLVSNPVAHHCIHLAARGFEFPNDAGQFLPRTADLGDVRNLTPDRSVPVIRLAGNQFDYMQQCDSGSKLGG